MFAYVSDTNAWVDIFGLSGRGGDLHRERQEEIAKDIEKKYSKDKNVKVVTEGRIKLDNGLSRYGDVVVIKNAKIIEVHQIGEMRERGGLRPSSRERGAIMDIRSTVKEEAIIVFHSKKRGVETLQDPDLMDGWKNPNKKYRKTSTTYSKK